MTLRLSVGTKNAHKITELERILAPELPGLVLTPSSDEAPEETGLSFSDNALIKARSAFEAGAVPSIADDSGIAVSALGGAPGIHSARYAGTGEDADNTALLLRNMAHHVDRSAAFVCAAAFVWEGGEVVVERRWEGSLAMEPAGEGGFGYDPVFIPAGHAITAAQMAADAKDQLSHRGQAFRALAVSIREALGVNEDSNLDS